MSARTGEIIRGTILLVLLIGAAGWVVVRSVLKAEDPAKMVFKWVFTLIVVGFIVKVVAPIVGQGGYGGAFGGIPLTALCGLVLAIIWRHDLASLVASPFASLYDGGNEEPEPKPAYSIAQSKQKQGKYLEAVAEIRKQLDRFPTDFEGHILLAQIQAEDLKDLPAAEITVQRLCAQPDHAPKNIAFALYSMADWHLQIGHDPEAARASLQQIIDLFPDSEMALGAAQRIAHLSTPERALNLEESKKFAIASGPQNIGLLREQAHLLPAEIEPSQAAAEYVRHLSEHPLDMEAREKLAVIYADHYQRLDLATDELEQMIQQPHQPAKLVVHWLNLLADLQIRSGADQETVTQTLQRIIDRGPNLAAAEMARNRLARLKLELKANQKNQAIKLGTYEQNIGLKRGNRAGLPPA